MAENTSYTRLAPVNFEHNRLVKASTQHNRTIFKIFNQMCNAHSKNPAKHAPYYCISYQEKLMFLELDNYVHFTEIRLKYSNRAVAYSNTAVRKG